MRYIGNKSRLLGFILDTVRRLGIAPGRAHDAFAGTASVGRALKAAGWGVASSDLMAYSYVFQRAYVVSSRAPRFAALRAARPELARAARSPALGRRAEGLGGGALGMVAAFLSDALEPEDGFVAGHFAPAGGRMYFTDENARRIDAARRTVHEWRRDGLIDEGAYYLLLAGILEGADRVANTAGVYAAYIKQWQPNALRPFAVLPTAPCAGPRGSSALCADAAVAARLVGSVDLLYVDPPYNARQYGGYYHVPEILARGWFDGASPAVRGKTGLLADRPTRSRWCSARGAREALRELLAATDARHVLVSYNSEGLLADDELRAALARAAADGRVRRFTRAYRRYRADSDREGRRYRGSVVRELLYYARLR